MFSTPILLIIFNRPDVTAQVFSKIKEIKPKYLFVAADGPRIEKSGENELCEQTRAIIQQIDWQCELKTLFRKENLGCGVAPAEAISWFFKHVEKGIILEDDCLPNTSFFSFCEILLEYYKNEPRIMHIGGTNSQFGRIRGKYSYYFSKYPHIWGWATWRTSWETFKFSFVDVDETQLYAIFEEYKFTDNEMKYWLEHWNLVKNGNRKDIWDIQWTFSCWLNRGITIVPNINLISNIGFNQNATHTKSDSILANLPTRDIGVVKHPKLILINTKADNYTFTKYNLLEQPAYLKLKDWVARQLPKSVKEKLKQVLK